jgi:hypothetical protein
VKLTYTSPASIATASYPAAKPAGSGSNTTFREGEDAGENMTEIPTALVLFPNPTTRDNVNLQVIYDGECSQTMHIVDMTGRIVHTQQLPIYRGANEFTLTLPASMAAGVYSVTIPALGLHERLSIQ